MLLDGKTNNGNITVLAEECTFSGDLLIQEACIKEGLDLNTIKEVEKLESNLSEQKTIVRFNKQAKIAVLKGRAATIIAKEKNDPRFAKMMFYRRKYIEYKRAIQDKYASQANRRAIMAFKTGNLVEPSSQRSV